MSANDAPFGFSDITLSLAIQSGAQHMPTKWRMRIEMRMLKPNRCMVRIHYEKNYWRRSNTHTACGV